MATASLSFTIPPPISRKVRWLRRFVRAYVAIEGMAAVVIAICVAFWACLLLDWSFEPSPTVRIGMWCVALAAVGFVAWRRLFSRIFAPLTDSNLALLLERSFPQIEQSLITTVQAGRRGSWVSEQQNELLSNTSRVARERIAAAPLSRVFRYRPLVGKIAVAGLMIGTIVGFATLRAEAYRFWIERAKLSAAPWPRDVELSVTGFEEVDGQRVSNVARDDDFQLNVAASLLDGHKAPSQVEIRYTLADGRRGRDTLTQIGAAVVGTDDAQQFRYEFKTLSTDMKFDIIGGDDQIRNLKLHVVERPQIVRTALECEFPRYLEWAPQTMPFSGRVEVPYGTTAVCQIEVNKPLHEVHVYDATTKEEISAELAEDESQQFSFHMDSAQADRVLLVDLKDTEGVTNREPYRLMIAVLPDELPEVAVQLRGIGSAVTPNATIPILGTIVDDHGVTEAWIDGEIAGQESQRRLLPSGDLRRENSELGRFDLAAINPQTQQRLLVLDPGEKIVLSIKAQDAYDLDTEPHIGSSQRFVLDVVTDSQLRALLEKRELGLRQRFEAIHEKMISTRELITRIEMNPQGEDARPLSNEEISLRRDRDNLRVTGILQNITQSSYETLGVAEGFEDIVTELVNNRIDTEELTQRLGRDIAEPLRNVAGELMSDLEKRVQQLPEALDGAADAENRLAESIIQADLVVESMQRILDRMLELEGYNELVELLRGIVEDQKQLNEETKVRRLEKLRSLLDEE